MKVPTHTAGPTFCTTLRSVGVSRARASEKVRQEQQEEQREGGVRGGAAVIQVLVVDRREVRRLTLNVVWRCAEHSG